MTLVLYILAELAIGTLLAVLIFFSLLFQPDWIWIAAPLTISFVFIAIANLAGRRNAWSLCLVFISPIAITGYFLTLAALAGPRGLGVLATVVPYYVIGVLLLGAHHVLNAKVMVSRQEKNAEPRACL